MEVRRSPIEDLSLSRKGILEYLSRTSTKPFTEQRYAKLKLFQSSDREIARLIINIKDLDYVSLHTRNIFELYLIILQITSSKSELARWYGQQHKDSTEVRIGFRKLLIKKNLDTTALDEIQKFEDASLDNSPYQSERNFNISNLAKLHGYEDDYGFLYKLSSKLVHPSSLKVNNYDVLTESENYLNVVLQLAVFFAQKVEKLARSTIEI